jgi:excisionase family DNA binding protein
MEPRPGTIHPHLIAELEQGISAIVRVIVDGVQRELQHRPNNNGTSPVTPRLLSVSEAATYLGRSKASVQHLAAQRRIPVVREGRRIFLDVRELDRWIAANTEPAEGG